MRKLFVRHMVALDQIKMAASIRILTFQSLSRIQPKFLVHRALNQKLLLTAKPLHCSRKCNGPFWSVGFLKYLARGNSRSRIVTCACGISLGISGIVLAHCSDATKSEAGKSFNGGNYEHFFLRLLIRSVYS